MIISLKLKPSGIQEELQIAEHDPLMGKKLNKEDCKRLLDLLEVITADYYPIIFQLHCLRLKLAKQIR